MSVTAIVGANWGDEGKGKITDTLAGSADYVVRFQGGNNAGHTIINDYGKFALHLLPAGVFRATTSNVLGPGVAVNPRALLAELDELSARGVPAPRLRISNRAQLVMPYHIALDVCEEARLGHKKFGSTQCGIAPFYADKYLKLGIQVADLFDKTALTARIQQSLAHKQVLFKHLYKQPTPELATLVSELLSFREQLAPYICDTTELLHKAMGTNQSILLEGQLGALRDPDHGVYPFPTSSSPLAGFASVGAGIPPHTITRVVAVAKAYSSCVGACPFVTELIDSHGNRLRANGGDAGEFGATTGRPRRVGWFDAVATRYGCQVQGATEVALSLLDVLGYLDQIPICTAYEIDGKSTTRFPTTVDLQRARPIYEILDGWRCDIRGIRRYGDLPRNARRYVERIERSIGVPITYISNGPHREALISLK